MVSLNLDGVRPGQSAPLLTPNGFCRTSSIKEPPGERFDPGQTIVWEGDDGRHVFQLLDGTVRHCLILVDGRRIVAGFGHAGDMFGFSSNERYLFSTEAVTECRVRRFAWARSVSNADNPSHEERDIRQRLHLEYVKMQENLLQLLHNSSDERVASFLLRTANHLRQRLASGDRFVLSMSRADIADHLGLSVETVCRAITRLRREGIVELEKYGTVLVKNVERLRKQAGVPAFEH